MADINKKNGPLQNLFVDIKKIIDYIELKDVVAAYNALDIYSDEERDLVESEATTWMNAKVEDDSYITYHKFWKPWMFQEVEHNMKYNDIRYYIESAPHNVPLRFRNNLLLRGREAFLNQYEEKNNYYRKLNGLPNVNTPKSDYIILPEPMRNQLHATSKPVHELSELIQNSWMNTDHYKELMEEVSTYPNASDYDYLKYLGSYKIDPYIARKAKDFEIIRYGLNRSDINPYLIKEFASLWDSFREYVMVALYNTSFEEIYPTYRTFMRLLIEMFVLLHINFSAVESLTTRNYLDDTIIHIMLDMYDLDNDMLMTNEVRRKLSVNILQLIQDKGNSDIYDKLVNILGYNDVIIKKYMLMKGQQFDANNDYEALEEVDPYFIPVNIDDDNIYKTISDPNVTKLKYHDVIDNDPSWWDLSDTQKLLEESNYSIADTKYISIEAFVQQMQFLFESICFPRMIINHKENTENFMINIPELFGTESQSLYDLIIFIIAAACLNDGMGGNIIYNSEESNEETKIEIFDSPAFGYHLPQLVAISGFNFDLNFDTFMEYLDNCKYAEVERVRDFISNLTVKNSTDINRIFNEVMYPMREWLENKIEFADTRGEIQEKYNISDDDLKAYKHFYPRSMDGTTITVGTFNESRYEHPFFSRLHPVDWYLHIVVDTPYGEDDRGYLYFNDILNSPDIRYIKNKNNNRIFYDTEDGVTWSVNKQAVNKAIELLEKLPEDALYQAYFQVDTPILNSGGKMYEEGQKLPLSIRSSTYKDILLDKFKMDMDGLAELPKTYQEYLYRRNRTLYNLLIGDNTFYTDRNKWLNNILNIILAIETHLSLHMKYYEQSVVGISRFFKPLSTMIRYFKSTFIHLLNESVSIIMDDKMDVGGNSNMFKLFDEINCTIKFITLAHNEWISYFGLYDTFHKTKYKFYLRDKYFGFRDECKFYLNGKPIDPDGQDSRWFPGEKDSGLYSDKKKIHMKNRKNSIVVDNFEFE